MHFFFSFLGSPLENGTILHKTEVIESLTTEKETQNMGTEVCTTITEVHTKETIETVTESHAVESEVCVLASNPHNIGLFL